MERNPITDPITHDNFPEMWEVVDNERRTAKKKKFVSGVTAFFGHMLLAILMLLTGNGLLYNHTTGSYHDFLESLPCFLSLWKTCSVFILKPDQNWQIQLLICLAVIYVICFVFCFLLVYVLELLYHPLKKKLPTRSDKENAKLMLSHAHHARVCANDTRRTGAAVLWTFLTLFGYFMLIQQYVLEFGVSGEQIIQSIFPRANLYAQAASTNFLLVACAGAFMLTFVCSLIAAVHTLTVQFMYRFRLSYAFVAEVERYYVLADEKTAGLTKEEIEELRSSKAELLLKQALDLESCEIYKKSRRLLMEAAHLGNVEAMEHYARHNLITHNYDPARYWLEKSIATGKASPNAAKQLKLLKWHRNINVRYRRGKK